MTNEETAGTADEAAFRAALDTATRAFGRGIEAHCLHKMWEHYLLVTEANRFVNLTRITGPAEAAVKHYADSLALLACPEMLPDARCTLLDVGTGAGFPAIPLALVCPDWKITAIDGTAKKVRFVQEAVARLSLANVRAHHCRAADWDRTGAARFDRVVLRAVSKIGPGLAEVHRLVRPGGQIIFYKTAHIDPEEIEGGRQEAVRLSLEELPPIAVELTAGPTEVLHRRLVRYRRKG